MKTKNSPSSSNRLSSTIGEQRNEPIIHNVTSVKYNKENEIVSHYLTKKLKNTSNCTNFTVRKALYSKIITIIDNFVGHKN